MRLSSIKADSEFEKEIFDLVFQIIADTNKKEEAEELLKGILTKTELTSVAKRVAVAKYLNEGLAYTEIAKKIKISSATISLIQTQMQENPGFQIVLEKIRLEKWASEWEKKIKSLFTK